MSVNPKAAQMDENEDRLKVHNLIKYVIFIFISFYFKT